MSSPLQHKMARFGVWDVGSDRQQPGGSGTESTEDEPSGDGWHEAEREHRRKSRAFAAAAAKRSSSGDSPHRPRRAVSVPAGSGPTTAEAAAAAAAAPEYATRSSPGLSPRLSTRPSSGLSPRLSSRTSKSPRDGPRRTASGPQPSTSLASRRSSSSSSTGRRKRTPSTGGAVSMVPPAQRIFDGLAFYYIPDADLGPRKLRIAKARQFGAQWVRRLDAATHVIVDKKLSWADIQVVLQGGSSGGGGESERGNDTASRPKPPVLVNEEYPLDCIGFRCLLNPDQRQYRIPGRPGSTPASAPADAATAAPASKSASAAVRTYTRGKSRWDCGPIKADTSARRRLGTPPPPVDHELSVKRQRRGGGLTS